MNNQTKLVEIRPGVTVGDEKPFALIAGPCVIENRELCREVAAAAREACGALGIPYIFKASFDKANRTSGGSYRGLGMAEGLEILAGIREEFDVPVLTDVYAPEQCAPAAEAVDVLQIPAFLSRQTDLLLAAGRTGKPVNIKKGQFLAPWDMANAAGKVASTGNEQILLCERGAMFGYNTLVVDMRALPIMAKTGYPVVFDATHAVATPGGLGDRSGGEREFGPVLARAAVAVGVAAIFLEVHQDPDRSGTAEADTMLPLKALPELIETLLAFDRIAKARRTKR